MGLTIYPAIDIRNGKCVRLVQGDYDRETIFHERPVEVAKQWVAQGAKWLHVVDLDGARSGESLNGDVIEAIVLEAGANVQVGGGVRNMERLDHLLSLGVARVVIGSAAIDDPDFVREAIAKYGDKVAIGIDARDGYVATHGWRDKGSVTAVQLAGQMAQLGAKTFIVTDIDKDGLLSGINGEFAAQIARVTGVKVIASGGVANVTDIRELANLTSQGVSGVVVGKALYTKAMTLAEALEEAAR